MKCSAVCYGSPHIMTGTATRNMGIRWRHPDIVRRVLLMATSLFSTCGVLLYTVRSTQIRSFYVKQTREDFSKLHTNKNPPSLTMFIDYNLVNIGALTNNTTSTISTSG